ncbi:thioesterase II family protein [Corynebacterium mastitidis]|uniref:thioesterase II family protein n=1 Tax=Corynebacterium mastitidis TaxID=161890 RepID=UPI000366F605|nr:alpha/beta fold hydrolase [Corynebacterium mastitidis]
MSGVLVPVPGGWRGPEAPAVVVFPHAGGSPRQYAAWSRAMAGIPGAPSVLGAIYPGRDRRMSDPHPLTLQDLAREIADAFVRLPEPPAVLAGHSLGATVAAEAALELRRRGAVRRPPVLVVSGQASPDLAGGGGLHRASDEELLADVSRIGDSTARALADPDVAALHLPAIREDYRLIETYRSTRRQESVMTSHIVVVRGSEDTELPLEAAAGWHRWGTRVTGPVRVPGDHLHHLTRPELALLCGGLARKGAEL